jgi:RecB family exonuclease
MAAAASFGGSLHRTLDELHRAAEELPLETVLAIYRGTWSAHGYASDADEAAHLARGEEMLRAHHERGREVGRVSVLTEAQIKYEYDEFVLFGKVDRVDRLPDGSPEVIDYKSGRSSVSEADVRDSLAMTAYQLILARAHPGTQVRATLLALSTGASATITRSPAELDAAEQGIRALALQLLADREYRATPGVWCGRCQFARICPWAAAPAPPAS